MAKCKKKGFDNVELANKKISEIYKETKKSLLMRAYKCKECSKFHLTKMTKHKHKFFTDKTYRKDIQLKSFLKTETEYWNRKFNISD